MGEKLSFQQKVLEKQDKNKNNKTELLSHSTHKNWPK